MRQRIADNPEGRHGAHEYTASDFGLSRGQLSIDLIRDFASHLGLQLERLQLIDQQIQKLNGMIAGTLRLHQEAVVRLAEVPGFGVDSAQQVISEVGVQASTFPSAAQLTSWVGTCPGKDESAEENHNSRSAKGNKYLRRIPNQAAHAAVKKKGSYFQAVFRRLLPRLGYKAAIWAIALRLCRVV